MGLYSRPTRRHIAIVTLATAVVLFLTANAASAATVSVVDGTITYTAGPDEENDLRLYFGSYEVGGFTRHNLLFVDDGATIKPGRDCARVDDGVACDDAESDAARPLKFSLGNRNDRVDFDDCHGDNRPITVWGSRGNDSIIIGSCGGSHAVVYGGAHDDFIFTWLNHGGFSRLHGGDGRDQLIVNEGGRAFLYGGPNHDFLSYNTYVDDDRSSPTDSIEARGGSGNDTIRPSGMYGVEDAVFGESGNDTLAMAEGDSNFFDMAACAMCDLERVIGTSGDDVIYGDEDANTIWSGGGNDTIDPRGGHDYVYSGAGDDTVTSRDGVHDTIRCGEGLLDTVFADRRESLGECEVVHRPATAGVARAIGARAGSARRGDVVEAPRLPAVEHRTHQGA
jgi:Ca2+-binding RTX toxin-like protein